MPSPFALPVNPTRLIHHVLEVFRHQASPNRTPPWAAPRAVRGETINRQELIWTLAPLHHLKRACSVRVLPVDAVIVEQIETQEGPGEWRVYGPQFFALAPGQDAIVRLAWPGDAQRAALVFDIATEIPLEWDKCPMCGSRDTVDSQPGLALTAPLASSRFHCNGCGRNYP